MDKGIKRLSILNILVFAVMVAVNALASILPINGMDTGAVSDAYPNLFAPAPITFAIWGLIYAMLLLFVLYGLGAFGKKGGSNGVKAVGSLFIISSLANIAWIFSWHYQIIPLALGLMVVILLSLMAAFVRVHKAELSGADKFFVRMPFSLYFGWITVATIANTTTFLVDAGWNGFGIAEPVWMVVAIAAALLLGGATTLRFKDWAYGAVILWAFAGIYIKHTTTFGSMYPLVVWAVVAAFVLQAVAFLVALFGKRKKVA